jgi:hypothetical protein
MGCRTPSVGAFTFTRAVMEQMRLLSRTPERSFTVSQLHARLSKAEVGLQTTPVLTNLSGTGDSIQVSANCATKISAKEGQAYYSFTVTVTDQPTKSQVAQISQWLKTAAPTSISDVTIDKILLRSQYLQLVTETRVGGRSRNTFLEKLPLNIQNDVKNTLVGVTRLVEGENFRPNSDGMNTSKAETFIRELDECTKRGAEVVQEAALALSGENLKALENDDLAQNLGLSQTVNMLLHNMGERRLSPPKLPGDVEITTSNPTGTHFASGILNKDAVVVEYMYYQEDHLGGPPEGTTAQVAKLSALFSQGDPSKFHILPSLGSFHDLKFSRYGLVFRNTSKNNFEVLSTIYDTTPRLALGHRSALAYALAESVMHFHMVGWLHGGLRSENIVVLGSDYACPMIFGCDYSRTEVELSRMSADFVLDHNIYRHHDRWGLPSKEFSKIHDLYALVCIIFQKPAVPVTSG